jgi:hypothetical protein
MLLGLHPRRLEKALDQSSTEVAKGKGLPLSPCQQVERLQELSHVLRTAGHLAGQALLKDKNEPLKNDRPGQAGFSPFLPAEASVGRLKISDDLLVRHAGPSTCPRAEPSVGRLRVSGDLSIRQPGP